MTRRRLLKRLRSGLAIRVPEVATLTGLSVRPFTLEWSDVQVAAAYSETGRILLSYSWFKAHPDDYGCLVHEYTHVIQNVPGGTCPGDVIEGFADAVRYLMDLYYSWWTPSATAAQIAAMSPEKRVALSQAMASGEYDSRLMLLRSKK
jgi:Peptidase of plants and bacteria